MLNLKSSYLNNTITSYKQFDDFTYSSWISMLCMCWFSPLNVTTCHDDLQQTYLFRRCHQYNLLHRSTCVNSLHPHMCHGRNTWLWHNRLHLQSNWQMQRNDILSLHICWHRRKYLSLHVQVKWLWTVSQQLKVTTCHENPYQTNLFRSCHQYNLLHRSTCVNSLHPRMCHGRSTWLWHNHRYLKHIRQVI